MSNPSLKEQLTALSFELSSNKEKPKKQSNPPRKVDSNTKAKPAWLEQVQYGVELLKAHFPACFKEGKEIQPLKIGIKLDLVKSLGTREDIVITDKACMVSSLSYYVNSPTYHKTVVEGAPRIDLAGNPAGIVSAAEAQYSNERRQAKLQKKKSLVKKTPITETAR